VVHVVDAPRGGVLNLTDELVGDGRPSVPREQGRSPEFPVGLSEDLVDQQVGQALE